MNEKSSALAQKKASYVLRAVIPAILVLFVYVIAFLLLVRDANAAAWIGFAFAVLSLLLTGTGIALAVLLSDSLQTAVNIAESLQALWLYPAVSIIWSIIAAVLPLNLWKIILLLDLIILAAAIIFCVIGISAAIRMTQLDRQSKELRTEK